eukprot:1690558-Alexandrium_andersonii.AAC.1
MQPVHDVLQAALNHHQRGAEARRGTGAGRALTLRFRGQNGRQAGVRPRAGVLRGGLRALRAHLEDRLGRHGPEQVQDPETLGA